MKRSWLAILATACTVVSGCVPVHPSEKQLVGRWRVVWKCGAELLELKPDSGYVQQIDYAGGGHATHSGTWTVEQTSSGLDGSSVVLRDAETFCSVFGEKLSQPEHGDRKLETIWEWGRTILSFNPDWQGFERD